MADAVGARNIWDCLGQLQSSGGDSSASSDVRSSIDLTEAEARRQCENFPDTICAQQLQCNVSACDKSVSRSRKAKKRESIPLLANMQKKLKISHLNMSQKPAGLAFGKVDLTGEHESPLDLSTKSDDSASMRLPECPLDLSLKRESENMLSHHTFFRPVCTSACITEESLCITNLASQSGGLITISQKSQGLPCSQKKVSPVRPHIGGKPVVTDSNGNIPLSTFSEAGVKRNVFSDISAPAAQGKSVLFDCLQGIDSKMQQCGSPAAGLSEACFGKSGSLMGEVKGSQNLKNPVLDIEATQNLGIYYPVASVIDYCSNEVLCSSRTAVIPSCSSSNIITIVPDLVRSVLGLDSCSNNDSRPDLSSEPRLNVPTYKCQKKAKTISKKTLKVVQNVGDVQKRKSVPLAEVRPHRMVHSTPTKTTETSEALMISESVSKSQTVLSPSEFDGYIKSGCPVPICSISMPYNNVAGQTLDSSGSPPTLSLFSPLSKPCISSSEGLLLSPQMPILSPRAMPSLSFSTGMSSVVPRVDASHPIYSFSNCSMDAGSTTETKTSVQFSGSLTCDYPVYVPSEVTPQASMEASMGPLCIASDELMFGSTASQSENQQEVSKSSTVLPQPNCLDDCLFGRLSSRSDKVESDQTSEPGAGHFTHKKRGISDQTSTAINAFVLNSDFSREIYKKSKLCFHAAQAFDLDACASENARPCKDMITKTKYYKLIAPKFGFAVNTNKDSAEPVLPNRSPSKPSREACQKGGRNSKVKPLEQAAPLVKDLGGSRQESGSKILTRRSRAGLSDAKQSHSGALDTSECRRQDSVCVEKLEHNTQHRSCGFKEEPSEDSVIQLNSNTLDLDSKRTEFCMNAVTSSYSNCLDFFNSSEKEFTGESKVSRNVESSASCRKGQNRLASKRKTSPLVSVVPNKKEKSGIYKGSTFDHSKNVAESIKTKVPDLQVNSQSDVLHKSNEIQKSDSNKTNETRKTDTNKTNEIQKTDTNKTNETQKTDMNKTNETQKTDTNKTKKTRNTDTNETQKIDTKKKKVPTATLL